ncbi:hypothetical protein D3C81_1500830 [compost metagenome]
MVHEIGHAGADQQQHTQHWLEHAANGQQGQDQVEAGEQQHRECQYQPYATPTRRGHLQQMPPQWQVVGQQQECTAEQGQVFRTDGADLQHRTSSSRSTGLPIRPGGVGERGAA